MAAARREGFEVFRTQLKRMSVVFYGARCVERGTPKKPPKTLSPKPKNTQNSPMVWGFQLLDAQKQGG